MWTSAPLEGLKIKSQQSPACCEKENHLFQLVLCGNMGGEPGSSSLFRQKKRLIWEGEPASHTDERVNCRPKVAVPPGAAVLSK